MPSEYALFEDLALQLTDAGLHIDRYYRIVTFPYSGKPWPLEPATASRKLARVREQLASLHGVKEGARYLVGASFNPAGELVAFRGLLTGSVGDSQGSILLDSLRGTVRAAVSEESRALKERMLKEEPEL